jgi:hypothetical protein
MDKYLVFIIILAIAIAIIALLDPSWAKWVIVGCCAVIVLTIIFSNWNSEESANSYAAAQA